MILQPSMAVNLYYPWFSSKNDWALQLWLKQRDSNSKLTKISSETLPSSLNTINKVLSIPIPIFFAVTGVILLSCHQAMTAPWFLLHSIQCDHHLSCTPEQNFPTLSLSPSESRMTFKMEGKELTITTNPSMEWARSPWGTNLSESKRRSRKLNSYRS